jgi:hypothetical protein
MVRAFTVTFNTFGPFTHENSSTTDFHVQTSVSQFHASGISHRSRLVATDRRNQNVGVGRPNVSDKYRPLTRVLRQLLLFLGLTFSFNSRSQVTFFIYSLPEISPVFPCAVLFWSRLSFFVSQVFFATWARNIPGKDNWAPMLRSHFEARCAAYAIN